MSIKERFIGITIAAYDFSRVDAEKIYEVYSKLGILVADGVAGGYTLSHGVYGDKDIMEAAVKLSHKMKEEG